MVKFFKSKKADGIVKCCECRTTGEVVRVCAIIGQVKVLLENEIIFKDNTTGNLEKWLVIDHDGDKINEFNSKEDAKEFCKATY